MKNILVVGGSSGIGKQLTQQLSEQNSVFATYNRNAIPLAPNVTAIHWEVSQPFPLDTLPEMIHGLVYCPGAIALKPFQRFSEADFINDYQFQVLGAVKIIQSVLPKMKLAESASIVLFSTVAVQTGFPFHSLVASSKGAIEGLTRALAAELSPKIRVNAIAPSITDTPLAANLLNTEEKVLANANRHPLKRVGTPKNIADAACFLLSEESAWMTGQVLKVDGGISTLKI